jgi:hypothetical protein
MAGRRRIPLSSAMANAFDPYREALVVEEATVWPDAYDAWEEADRERVGRQLHAAPQQAAELDYLQLHTGFCRQITVTAADLERVGH